jgi:predicted ATPase
MKSEDPRYDNAYQDIHQHIVNNDDWTIEYLFEERLRLIESEESLFIKFIETIVNPSVRYDVGDIIFFVSGINEIISSSGHKLILSDYFEGEPIYKYKEFSKNDDLPIDIIPNSIPIYMSTYNEEIIFPCFKLNYVDWNDYSLLTKFILMYFVAADESYSLGTVKIMKREQENTSLVLEDKFLSLDSDFCSLGQTHDYYYKLKEILGIKYNSFLLAMKDVATFPRIHEQFENDPIFTTSLIRNDDVERLARTIRYEIEGISPNEYYKFNFSHKPPYAKNEIVFDFDFEYDTDFEHRIFAIIGKNGSGKTKMMSTLVEELSNKESKSFSPRKPVYGKVFTLSYSFFDRFKIPESDASFNYVYCGLKKGKNEWKSEEDMLVDFHEAVSRIKEKKLETKWYAMLSNFIVEDVLNIAFEKEDDFIDGFRFEFNEGKFNEVRTFLSSGQSIILYTLSEVLSHIRYDSLILFDEPETHLHPNAISSLLNTLFDLVKEFQSFCIIATHSPLIIREIQSRNIFIMEREDDSAYLRKLERESFGENLTVITQEIFGNRDVPNHFITIIKDLIDKGRTYEQIIDILESDNLPISSSVKLYINALMKSK